MQVNGYKTFKIETTTSSDTGSTSQTTQTGADTVEEDLDALFGSDSSAPSSVQDAYMIGSTSAASAETAAVIGQLESVPPSLDEVLAANPNARYRLDLVIGLYEEFGKKLDALIASYDEAIALLPTGSQLSDVKAKRDMALDAKFRNGQYLDAAKAMYKTVTDEDMKELQSGLDLNNDGILGPREYGIGVVYDDDGIHYFDLQTKTPIPRPIIDIDYPCQIFDNDAVKIIDKDDARASGDPNEYPVDLYLQLNQEAIESKTDWTSETNTLGSTVNFVIPETLWVERDGKKVTPKIDDGVDDVSAHLTVAGFVSDETGIHQDISSIDKSKYVQVQVAKVEVYSAASGHSIVVDGRTIEGQDTYICLYDKDGNVITRMRIEGFESGNLSLPQGMLLEDGTTVAVDASNVSLGMTGYMRASPVEIDASNYVSLCHKRTDEFASKIGVDGATAEMQGTMAYQETVSFFQDTNYETRTYNHDHRTYDTTGTTIEHPDTEEGGAAYNEFHDRFSYAQPDRTRDTISCEQTGVFMTDVTGLINGSNQRDVVIFRGVNDLPEYWKNKDLPNTSEVRKGDPLYMNVYHGDGGGDVVTAKQGDFMGDGISFGWFEAASSDTVAVQVMEGSGIGNPNADRSTSLKDAFNNPKNFVYIEGASDSFLRDNGEMSQTLQDANDYAPYFNNDAYYLHGTPHVVNTQDDDIHMLSGASALDDSVNAWPEDLDFSEPENNLRNAINGYYADDDFDVPEDIQTEIEGTYSAAVEAELNGFFEEAYGAADSMYTELLEYLNS